VPRILFFNGYKQIYPPKGFFLLFIFIHLLKVFFKVE
jgi:hypothetical protein